MLAKFSLIRSHISNLQPQSRICTILTNSSFFTHKSLYYSSTQDPTDSDTTIIQKFLNQKQQTLKQHKNVRYKFKQFIVPKDGPSIQDLQKKLQKDWKYRKLALNIDPSALIGQKRTYMRNHLQQNIYEGASTPDSLFTQVNPTIQVGSQQLRFDPDDFIFGDPLNDQIQQRFKDLPEQEQQDAIEDAYCDLYQAQPQRFGNRLKKQLNVPQPFQKIIQHAISNENQIFFCGMGQYSFRNLIMRTHNLEQIKQLFMLSLKFAQTQSIRTKISGKPIKGKLQDYYTMYARQMIYLNNYKIIKKAQNGQVLRKIGTIAQHKQIVLPQQQQYELLLKQQQQKQQQNQPKKHGRRGVTQVTKQKIRQGVVLLAHSYTVQTLNQFAYIQNWQQQAGRQQKLNAFEKARKLGLTKQQKQQLSKQDMQKSEQIAKQHQLNFQDKQNTKQTDIQKIQKHAILQAMLGDLWNKPYTLNKFPYISQNYLKLSEQDKSNIQDLYHKFLTKYTGAKKVYYINKINKFDDMSMQQIEEFKAKGNHKSSYEEYEKAMEQMNKRKGQRQQLIDKKQKIIKNASDGQEDIYKDYPDKYDQEKLSPDQLKQMKQLEKLFKEQFYNKKPKKKAATPIEQNKKLDKQTEQKTKQPKQAKGRKIRNTKSKNQTISAQAKQNISKNNQKL